MCPGKIGVGFNDVVDVQIDELVEIRLFPFLDGGALVNLLNKGSRVAKKRGSR